MFDFSIISSNLLRELVLCVTYKIVVLSFNLINNSSISLNKPLLKSEPKKHLIDPVKTIIPSELFTKSSIWQCGAVISEFSK